MFIAAECSHERYALRVFLIAWCFRAAYPSCHQSFQTAKEQLSNVCENLRERSPASYEILSASPAIDLVSVFGVGTDTVAELIGAVF